jgi:hypothetical protein
VATTDGECVWALRYASEHDSRSLFYTTDVPMLRELYPEQHILDDVSDDARLVVSEPPGDLPGVWNEVPESTCGVVGRGQDHLQPFEVKPPAKSVAISESEPERRRPGASRWPRACLALKSASRSPSIATCSAPRARAARACTAATG